MENSAGELQGDMPVASLLEVKNYFLLRKYEVTESTVFHSGGGQNYYHRMTRLSLMEAFKICLRLFCPVLKKKKRIWTWVDSQRGLWP